MSTISPGRLRQMSPDEIAWRALQAGRTAAQLLTVRVRPPQWHRADLGHAIADGVVETILPSDDDDPSWQAVHTGLRRRIAQRTSRFSLDPASAPQIRDAVRSRWPAAASEAVTRAENILAGRYDVLGYHQLAWGSPDGAVDWHLDPVAGRRAPRRFWARVPYLDPAIGDHKVIWELNRHQHWLHLGRALWLTGDRRYRQALIEQLESWLAANPPLLGINWASMLEIGIRGISWMWALHFLLADEWSPDAEPPWLVDMLVALDRQLNHVEQNLSFYFSPNTHLTGEALGLYVVGVALPELACSARWSEKGRTILIEAIGRQIRADGGHVERSTHYQRYTLDFYLMALLTAQRNHDAEAAAMFSDAVARLADYTRAMADDRGRLPLIGDDDGGMLWPIAGRACHDVRDSLSLAAVLLDRADLAPWRLPEEVVWIAGPPALERERTIARASTAAPAVSRTLADSGFVVLRDDSGSHATFDVGRHGFANGGHAHAGALSVTLGVQGRPLLIDPGTCTYTMDARLRDLFRSTLSHNTVTIDGRSQAIPRGPFHWQTRADAHLHGSRSNDRFGWAEASHDAYMPIRHRRTLVRTARGDWLIADEILGDACVTARTHWHFDPGWKLSCDAPGRLRATHAEGIEAWLLHDNGDSLLAHGDDDSWLGWYAPVYGMLVPTWTMRTTRRGVAPCVLLTCIHEGCGAASPSLERLVPVPDLPGTAVGARLVDSESSSIFLLRPGEVRERDNRTCRILDYQTNARVLHYREVDGHLVSLDIVDATHVVALRPNWISMAATEPICDLHVSRSNGVLDLYSSEPPRELRLHGAAVRTVRQIRLNRRPIDVRPSGHSESVVVYGADWALAAQSPQALSNDAGEGHPEASAIAS